MKDFGPDPVPPLEFYDELDPDCTNEQYTKIKAWLNSSLKNTTKPKIIMISTPSIKPHPFFKEQNESHKP